MPRPSGIPRDFSHLFTRCFDLQLFGYCGISRGGGLKGCCYFGGWDWEMGIEKSHKKTGECRLCSSPLHVNDVSAGERSSRNRSRARCSGGNKQGTGTARKWSRATRGCPTSHLGALSSGGKKRAMQAHWISGFPNKTASKSTDTETWTPLRTGLKATASSLQTGHKQASS